MTDDEIRNTCIDDIIPVGMDTAMEKIMAKTEEMKWKNDIWRAC